MMDDKRKEYLRLVQIKQIKDIDRQKEYEGESKERLKKILKKKLTTMMIGSISAIEEKFGFLFGFDDKTKALSPEEEHLKELFLEIRKKILDLGNNQINNIEEELKQYDIKWNRYTIKLPVKPQGENDGKENC